MNELKYLVPEVPDYNEYVRRMKATWLEPQSEEEYLAGVARRNEKTAIARAKEVERIRKANHLLYRTKRKCSACGGPILHRYKYYEPRRDNDGLIGPGPDWYGEDAILIKGKVHHSFYCKNCRQIHTHPAKQSKK